MKRISVDLNIIGVVHSPYKTTKDVPFKCKKKISEIEIYKEYEQGLKDIEGFTHVHVFYWLHKSRDYSLNVITPWDNTEHGLFATRSPNRPNPLGYTIVKIVEKKGNILRVRGLDAIDGSPVIDIKPYVKKFDIREHAVSGWLEKKI